MPHGFMELRINLIHLHKLVLVKWFLFREWTDNRHESFKLKMKNDKKFGKKMSVNIKIFFAHSRIENNTNCVFTGCKKSSTEKVFLVFVLHYDGSYPT